MDTAGQMVTGEELRQYLWPSDTFVDFDHSLNTAVMKLREALGDSVDKPLYINHSEERVSLRRAGIVESGGDAERVCRANLPAVAHLEETPPRANGSSAYATTVKPY